MSVSTGISLNEQGIAEISRRLDEPAWMREKRLAAWRAYQDLPMPRWDRTDLTGVTFDDLVIQGAEEGELSLDSMPEALRAVVGQRSDESALLIQVDSTRTWARIPNRLREQGVIVCDFKTALREHEELIKANFMSAVPFDEDKPTALHYAATASGFFVYVPKNTVVDLPIELRHFSERPGLALFPHLLIVADQGAEVTIVESVNSIDGGVERIVGEVVELCPKDGARIRFGFVQDWGEKTVNFTTRRAFVSRDANVEWMGGDFGSRLSRSHARSVLEGTGSESTNLSVFFGTESQHLDVGITMLHVGDHTSSDMLTKGVLDDRARVVYRGLTDIEGGARFTSGFQRENTMLLSKDARSDAIPGLEIDESEVQAGHAATVGQIDKVYLFYLMSRGLTKTDAIRLIVDGFFDPVLQRIPVEGVRDEIRLLIDRKMSA